MDLKQDMEEFFARYAARFNAALAGQTDVEGTAAAFAECFIEANPFGVQCGKNGDEFKAAITQGSEYYRSIGTRAMRVLAVDPTPLDEKHAMARVHWEADYVRRDGSELRLDFEVIYLLQKIGADYQVFAYVVGDEQGLLREKGLIP